MIGLGILVTAAYVPGWTGAAVLPGWVVLSLLLPFFLFNRIEMGPCHWLGLVFLAYASLSILWAPIWQQAVWDLWLTWVLAFCFCLRYDPKLWIGMALGLLVPLGFAIAQWFGFEPVYANNFHNTSGVYPGTFINPDMFGETACLISVALIASRIYWPLIITIPPIYLTQSRTVYVAYAAVIAAAIWNRWKWRSTIPILIVLLTAGWFTTADTPWRPGHHYAIAERLALWRDTAENITARGYGAGSFFMLYPKFAKRTDTMTTRPEDPHNEFLNLAFEYGVGILPVLIILALGLAAGAREGLILVAFLAIAFFSFPTRIPTEGFVGMVALGRLCSYWNMARIKQLLGRPPGAWKSTFKGRANRALEQVYSNEARL